MLLFYMVELLSELYGCSRHVPASENDCKWCLSELLIYHYFCGPAVRDVSQNNKQSNMVFCLETVSSHQEQFAKRDRLISSTNWCIYQLILPENVYFLFLEQKMYVFLEVISCSFFWVVASEKQWEVCAGD